MIFPVQRVGCFRDTSRRAIPLIEGSSPMLRGNYKRRANAIGKCSSEAIRRGYRLVGVQDGGQCFSGPRALRTFAKYGRSNRCRNGKGGTWANDIYRISGMLLIQVFIFLSFLLVTVGPRFNEPLYNEVLGITNDILQPGL